MSASRIQAVATDYKRFFERKGNNTWQLSADAPEKVFLLVEEVEEKCGYGGFTTRFLVDSLHALSGYPTREEALNALAPPGSYFDWIHVQGTNALRFISTAMGNPRFTDAETLLSEARYMHQELVFDCVCEELKKQAFDLREKGRPQRMR